MRACVNNNGEECEREKVQLWRGERKREEDDALRVLVEIFSYIFVKSKKRLTLSVWSILLLRCFDRVACSGPHTIGVIS